ncbi:autotransporter domain-containing protein [Shinella zoogloeoides]|nr:autotransporter domain-containing protein [Shinella zoogloeoides]UEX80395.1 autotransporter domain-containing protein [Shinella zoogloeoides]
MKKAASELTKEHRPRIGHSFRKWLCSSSFVVLAVAMPATLHAQEWTGTLSTNWATAGNWQGGAVPAGGDVTIDNEGAGWPIITGGTHNIGRIWVGKDGSGANLTIRNGAKLNSSDAMEIGFNDASSGTVTITGGGSQLNLANYLELGFLGTGTLNLSDGGLVTSQDGYLSNREGGKGTVNVTTGGTWNNSRELFVGYQGDGTLNIASTGTVTSQIATLGFYEQGTGLLTVDGAGSLFSSESLIVGRLGTGTITASNGGKIDSTSAIVGQQAGSNGSVSLTSGAEWDVGTAVTIGAAGTGTLSLSGGAQMTSAQATIGRNTGGVGTATVSGVGTHWANSGAFAVGRDGTGTMTLTNEAIVNSGAIQVGSPAGGVGTLTVSNRGYWDSTGVLNVGDFGTGTVNIDTGGVLLTTGGYVGNGGTGVVNIGTAGSVQSIWNAQNGDVWLGGANGDGSLTVGFNGAFNARDLNLDASGSGSATVTIQNNGFATLSNDVNIGFNAGTTGTVRVTGATSGLTATRAINVGSSGAGALTIDNGGLARASIVRAGFDLGATGTITVTGGNSRLEALGTFVVGQYGDGTLTVENLGRVRSWGGIIGQDAGGSGTVLITGDQSEWNATGGVLTVGNEGTASVTIADNARLLADQIHVGTAGTSANFVASGGAQISSGAVRIGSFAGHEGTATVTGLSTDWQITGGNLVVGGAANGSLSISDRAQVNVAGAGNRVIVGESASVTGTLNLFDNASLSSMVVPIWVGHAGNGILNVQSGALLETQGGIIGVSSGSSGAVTLSGANARWLAGGDNLSVGLSGNGSLTVQNGAQLLSTGSLIVGTAVGGNGTILLDGPSTIDVKNAGIGSGNGTGSMTISGGGILTTTEGGAIGAATAGGSGTGIVLVTGAGSRWNIGAPNLYSLNVGSEGTGTLRVENGALVNGYVDVFEHGTLSGNGAILLAVINNGGTLIGVQGDTLTFSELSLSSGANINVSLGTPGNASGLFNVNAALRLDGTLNVTNAGGFGQGVYRIFDYGGTLDDQGLDVGTMPSGTSGTVQTAVANQVNLLVTGMANDTQFWNGATTTADGTIHGGSGTWRMGPTNWTDVNGTTAAAWGSQFAIFQNNPGTVTVDGSGGAISTTGMQFIGQGWTVTGDTVALNGASGNTTIRVGDGTNAAHSATIASALTGASRLVKDDLGTLILTGANSYSGGTAINAGTLQIGNGGTSGSIAGNVQNNGTLAFNRSNDLTFGGQISGSGGIWQMGSGTTTLTGNSAAFTGGTDVAAGTLRVNGTLGGGISVMSGGTLTGSGTVGTVSVANGGILAGAQGQTLTTGNLVLASGATINAALGAAGGAGLFQVNGNLTLDGTLNVTDAGGFGMGVYRIVNYTGALTDNGLDIGTMPTLPAGTTTTVQTAMANQVNLVVDNGGPGPIPTMQFWNGATTTADGTIHGGSGTWRMGPTNWTDSAGATAAAWGGNFAVFQNNPGTVTVDGSGGAISTTGMQFIGQGWTVTGDAVALNGAGGNTTIRVGDGTSAGANWTTTISSALTGAGGLVKSDLGTLILAGNNTYMGETIVQSGGLSVTGSLAGAVNVAVGGRLGGNGTIGNTTVNGVIAPGNSIGTLNVGNITFNSGSIYEVEVNAAGQTDLINASGTATINGGSVQVLAGAGNYAPQTQYTILTAAGGRTGTFTGGVTSNLAFLDPSLSYDANNVYLTMTRNNVGFQNVGVTPNQIATGNGTESLGLGNPVYDAVLNLSASQAQYAFDQLSGEVHASAISALIEDSRFVRNAMWDRIRAGEDGKGYGVWGQAFGSWGHTNGNGNAAKTDRSTGGFFFGADGEVFDNARFGAVAGYSRTSFNTKDRISSGSSDNYHLGLYGGTDWGAVAFRSGLAYTWHDMDTTRNVAFPGFSDRLTAGYRAGTFQAFSEVGYGIDLGTAKLEPFANLAYVNFDANGFTEKGGAAALSGAGGSTNNTFTTLGLRASTSFTMGETAVTAKGTVGWRHAFGDTTPSVMMSYASGGSAFSIGGVPVARDLAVVEAGLDFTLSPNAILGVSYGGQFGSGVTDQSFRANFNVKF